MLQMDIVETIMKDCGFDESLRGSAYVRDAVRGYDPDRNFTELYAAIAEKRKSTPSRVERCMRHSIERVFERGDTEDLRTWFGGRIDPRSGKMTNKALVAALWHNAGGDEY